MIVRSFDDLTDTDRHVKTANWHSKRIVLAQEGAGFSLHETVLKAGTVNDMWYANHIEAVVCIEGEGELLDKETGTTYQITPGTMYLLNEHEHHQLRPRTRMRTICVFNPPVTGQEVHDENGVYPLITEGSTPDHGGGTEPPADPFRTEEELPQWPSARGPTITRPGSPIVRR